MDKKQGKLADSNPGGVEDAYSSQLGNAPEPSKTTLEAENHVITSVEQAIAVINSLEWDAQKLVRNAARITSLKQGRKPYDTKKLQKQGKGYKTNLSSGIYSTTLRRVAPRLYMPLLNASTLTAASLPPGTPDGESKTAFYRETITNAIRSWPRWGAFVRLITQEVVDYGFASSAFTDRYEWMPHLCRMDRGFFPAGVEIMDLESPFFVLKWDYQPGQLLKLARDAIEAGVEGWDKEAVAYAVQQSKPATAPTREPTGYRKWEELVREQVWSYATSKNYRVVESYHLYALEPTGKVSHYILNKEAPDELKLLCQQTDTFDAMADAVLPLTFNSTDGTIHGSWGAGHLLYDLGELGEKVFCDMVDNLRNANKQRLQVKDPKDINDVRQVVNDTEIILSGAEFANNLGGVQENTESYIQLRNIVQQQMDSKVGAYVPPIPMQPSDIKAAQVNAAMIQEKEISDDAVEYHLAQFAHLIHAMEKRLTDEESPEPKAVEVLAVLQKRLNAEELAYLRKQPSIKSVTDFTPAAAQARGQFAAAYIGNALFKQTELAKLVTQGVPGGGTALTAAVVIPDGDQTEATAAQRQQLLENAAMMLGTKVPVLVTDNHWIHMQTLKGPLIQGIQAGMMQQAQVGLEHYTAHWTAGVAAKTLPDEAINSEKSFIADAEKAIKALQQQQQMQQMQQQGGGAAVPGAAETPPPVAPEAGAMPGGIVA